MGALAGTLDGKESGRRPLRTQGCFHRVGELFGTGRQHAEEEEKEAFDGEHAEADREVVGPTGSPDRPGLARGRAFPLSPKTDPQDKHQHREAGPENGMQICWPAAQVSVGSGNGDGEEDAAH